MLLNRFYYLIKPHVPQQMRHAVRGWTARRTRAGATNVWPILEAAGRTPPGWPGWPGGKQFAVVLTHDVEGLAGLERIPALMRLEQEMGFRSSFNLVPEGAYEVTPRLVSEIASQGFEVGVHDLYHDGKLYRSRRAFLDGARRINDYLKCWGAVGFRSGFMFHNLDWQHGLAIEYDSSTFDVDPFEPQPDGAHTIFPFWVQRPEDTSHESGYERQNTPPSRGPSSSELSSAIRPLSSVCPPSSAEPPSVFGLPSSVLGPLSSGYVELPYTLPQDSTLFFLLAEKTIAIWRQKLDWIAANGGMVLVNTHPDYMRIPDLNGNGRSYPIQFYQELLNYLSSQYADKFWQALPREVAQFVRRTQNQAQPHRPTTPNTHASNGNAKPKIWIDLDNTPHVPFFEPILEELRSRGFPVVVTARDAFQVCDLADKKKMSCIKIGRHYGKNRLLKGCGLAYRALQLAPVALREKPVLAVSHGARSQLLLSNWLRIRTLLIEDYEYCWFPPMMRPTWVMVPSVIPDEALGHKNGQVRRYPGIKEDVYAWKLHPDPKILADLHLQESDIIVTVRPPATEAHYYNPESTALFEAFMNRALRTPQVRVVLLPRNRKQLDLLRQQQPKWFEGERIVIPPGALDGMNLIWHSDLVVSGGGTMNREAAALGVPVYSVFRGSIGAVDRHLKDEGRLVLVETADDVRAKINLAKRTRRTITDVTSKRTLENVVNAIQELGELCSH